MNAFSNPRPSDPPRFRLRVSEFTVSSHVTARGAKDSRPEFVLDGTVGPDPDPDGEAAAHPLIGRRLSVAVCGGAPSSEHGGVGWVQFVPGAPDIAAAACIRCCPRRVASLRATAHHAAGPSGGRLELILEVGPREETDGPVWRIPIRDAVIRATRRFDVCPAACMDDPADADEFGPATAREASAAR